MKKRTLLVAFISMMIICSTGFAQGEAQEGSGANQGGIGFQYGGAATIGGQLFYQLSQDMRLGTHLGFLFDGGDEYAKSTYAILFTPFLNYYFMKINSMSFFGQAAFAVNSGSYSEYDPNRAEWVTKSSTTTQFNINLGGEWFPTKSRMISIYGGINFLNINLNPFRFRVGLGAPFIGINWVIF